jgi:large subunit ribosomal protein L9
MKVILNKDIPNIGEEGDIKDVARGYARNFLIPKDLVMPYTREGLAILESRREKLDQRRDEKQKAAMDTKTRLESEELVLEMPAGERGRLFGSVTGAMITEALEGKGISVERKRLEIPDKTIKTVGTTKVRVRLYGDEEAELKVVVWAAGSKDDRAASASTETASTEATSTEIAAAEAAPVAEPPAPDDTQPDEAETSDEASDPGETPADDEAESTDDEE